MLKVVLVDDEEIIRDGLLAAVPWEDMGFHVVGQAEDGEQALQVIEDTHPDVVITDIKMPFIDGLQLIESIKPKYPDLYIVIISGHDEFQYAQKAIKLGAFDYILKPIELEYLVNLLHKLRDDNEQRRLKDGEMLTLKEKFAHNLPLLRERFFWDAIHENIEPENFEARLEDLKLLRNQFYMAVIVQLDNYYVVTAEMDDNQRRLMEKSFEQMMKGLCSDGQSIVLAAKTIHELVIAIWGLSPEEIESRLSGLLEKIHRKVSELGNYTATVGIGTIAASVDLLAQSYREAGEILDYKFILGKNCDLYFKNLNQLPKSELKSIDYDETGLISAIKLGDKQAVGESLDALAENLRAHGGSHLYMQFIIGDIYMQALKVLKEAGGSGEEVFNDPLEIFHKMIAYQTVEDITKQLGETLIKIIDYIYMKRNNKFYQSTEKAKEYLKLNFAKDDLTLEDVAKYVNMAPSYFSFIFKQEAGTNFVDFLNQIRLEKAKQLLMISDCKSYEVSYRVGYNNPTYFSTIFKKYVGVSPTEYKNQFKGSQLPEKPIEY
jgi:two-component system response regulator YesN